MHGHSQLSPISPMAAPISLLPVGVGNKLWASSRITSLADILHILVENSLAAGATRVSCALDVHSWGVTASDNGRGVSSELLRDELGRQNGVVTRGLFPASGSLAAVAELARIELTTLQRAAPPLTRPWHVVVEFGSCITCRPVEAASLSHPLAAGTTVCVRRAFFNVPVRQRQLSPAIETERCIDRILRLAVLHPRVAFTLFCSVTGLLVLRLPCVDSVAARVRAASGGAFGDQLVAIDGTSPCGKYRIVGCVGAAPHAGPTLQFAYVNGRPWMSPQRLLAVLSPLLERAASICSLGNGAPFRHEPGGHLPAGLKPSAVPQEPPPIHAVFALNVVCAPFSDCDVVQQDAGRSLVHFRRFSAVGGALAAGFERAFALRQGELQLLALRLSGGSEDDDGCGAVALRLTETAPDLCVELVAVGGAGGLRSADPAAARQCGPSWHWLAGSTETITTCRAAIPVLSSEAAAVARTHEVARPSESLVPTMIPDDILFGCGSNGRGGSGANVVADCLPKDERTNGVRMSFVREPVGVSVAMAPFKRGRETFRPVESPDVIGAQSSSANAIARLLIAASGRDAEGSAALGHPAPLDACLVPLATSRFFSAATSIASRPREVRIVDSSLGKVPALVEGVDIGGAFAFQEHRLTRIGCLEGSAPGNRHDSRLGSGIPLQSFLPGSAPLRSQARSSPHRVDRAALANLVVIGQLDLKFILAAEPCSGESMRACKLVIVDQHAADERVRLELMELVLFGSPSPTSQADGSAVWPPLRETTVQNALLRAFFHDRDGCDDFAISADGLVLSVATSSNPSELCNAAAQIASHISAVMPSTPLRLHLSPLEAHTVRQHYEALRSWGFEVSLEVSTELWASDSRIAAAAPVLSARTASPHFASARRAPPRSGGPSSGSYSEAVLVVRSLPVVFDVSLGIADLRDFLTALARQQRASSIASGAGSEGRGAELSRLFHLGIKPPALTRILHSKACRGAVMFGTRLTRSACVTLLRLLACCRLPFQCAHGRPSVLPLCTLLS